MLSFALTALASILFVVDPVGALPAYLAMCDCDSPAKRRRTAAKAALAAALVLAAFAAGGQSLFRLLGLLPGLDQISISLRDVVAAFVGSLIVLAAIGLWQRFQKSQ